MNDKKPTAKKFLPVILVGQTQVERVIELIKPLPSSGIIYQVTITEYKSNRSLAQNRTLHGWCKQISQQYAEATGKFYPAEHWKIYLKKLFLGNKMIEVGDEVLEIPISTAELKVDEFRKFLDDIDHYAGSELQIMLERGEDYALAIYGRKMQSNKGETK